MTRSIHLADGLTLPLDIVTFRTLVLGVSGAGKSTFGRLLAEQVHHAGQRFCVIDLKHDWWGLKSSADGKRPGIPVVVIGGPRADIPLDEHAGAGVADIVAEINHSVILDLDSLSKTKQIKFLGPFFERLYDVNRNPLLLICDEADRYAPQKPMSVEANVTLGAADDIARRGRKRGLGSLWLSQRPAVINKNVTTQCELTATFRTTSSLDLKELKEHIGRVGTAEQVDETLKQVGGLADGQAILLSQHPRMRMFKTVQFPMPETFDSSATPSVGQRRVEPKQLAALDLAALGERIKAAIAKAKAEDPRELRKRIVALEGELKKAKASKAAPAPATPKVKRVEVPVITPKDLAQLESIKSAFAQIGAKVDQGFVRLTQNMARILTAAGETHAFDRAPATHKKAPDTHTKAVNTHIAPSQPTPASSPQERTDSGPLGKGQRAVLIAIAQTPDGVSREQLSVLTGYKRSTRDLYLQQLGASGMIQRGDPIRATVAGIAELGDDFEALPTGDALRAHWMQKLPAGERAVLEVAVNAYPGTVGAEQISEETNYKRSTRDLYLQKLASRKLIERDRGEVKASATLFG